MQQSPAAAVGPTYMRVGCGGGVSGRRGKPYECGWRQSDTGHIAAQDTMRAQDTELCRPPHEVGAGVRMLAPIRTSRHEPFLYLYMNVCIQL
jgi:hypothetical protein